MSLRDIADMAGTSVATASRVLNNPDYRCQDSGLRERIFEAAKKLNYVPNASARQLKTGTSSHSDSFKVDVLLSRFNSLEEDVFFEEVKGLKKVFTENPELLKFLGHPDIELSEKVTTAEKIFEGRISSEIVGLLRIVVMKGRSSELINILDYFIAKTYYYTTKIQIIY